MQVGAVAAAALVRSSLRSQFRSMSSKISILPPNAGRRKTQLDRRFHSLMKFATGLHRQPHPPACLFEVFFKIRRLRFHIRIG